MLVGEFNTSHSITDRISSQKEIKDLNDKISQSDLRDITTEYTCFSRVHGTFSRTDHMISQKTSLNNYIKR